ncbi:MAG: hypothetical protein Q4B04_03610 [bacterium]|nr:hypothetical protein [bacterium]
MKKILTVVLVIALMSTFCLAAFAVESPTGTTITVSAKGNGSVEKTANSDGTFTLTAKNNTGDSFVGWLIDGDYEIVSGSLKSPVIVIKLASNATAVATFTGSISETSPQTGNNVIPFAVISFLALVSVFAVSKKIIAE